MSGIETKEGREQEKIEQMNRTFVLRARHITWL